MSPVILAFTGILCHCLKRYWFPNSGGFRINLSSYGGDFGICVDCDVVTARIHRAETAAIFLVIRFCYLSIYLPFQDDREMFFYQVDSDKPGSRRCRSKPNRLFRPSRPQLRLLELVDDARVRIVRSWIVITREIYIGRRNEEK